MSQLVGLLAQVQNESERATVQEAIITVSRRIPESENRAEAILQELNKTPGSQKPDLLEILPEMGGDKALEAVVEESRNTNREVQQAAMSALANWPEASALLPLAVAFQTGIGVKS